MTAGASVLCAKLSQDDARHSRHLHHVSVLLVTGRALDKVQGSGEGEGAGCLKSYHEHGEPCSRSRFVGMLLSILGYRSTEGAQAAIESCERCLRECEGQSTHLVPDFVKAGIVINNFEEQALRDHLVMHSDSTPMRSSSRRSPTSPERRARSARPQPAALLRLMLFVGTQDRARTRARMKITSRRRTLRTRTRASRRRRDAFTAGSPATGSRSA